MVSRAAALDISGLHLTGQLEGYWLAALEVCFEDMKKDLDNAADVIHGT
jgi:hypothetical protein